MNPNTIETIPDLVKNLPEFTGVADELGCWLLDADGLISLYKPKNNSNVLARNKFHVVCKAIRRKIKGEANNALVASNVNINLNLIKQTLRNTMEKKEI